MFGDSYTSTCGFILRTSRPSVRLSFETARKSCATSRALGTYDHHGFQAICENQQSSMSFAYGLGARINRARLPGPRALWLFCPASCMDPACALLGGLAVKVPVFASRRVCCWHGLPALR